jgi:hypothetical protein
MAKSLEDFLNECVARDPGADGLSLEELYGLYLSWCALEGFAPVRGRTFRTGLRAANIPSAHCGALYPGLVMAGPAACDYLVHRELPLAVLETSPARPQMMSAPADESVPALPGRRGRGVAGSEPAA